MSIKYKRGITVSSIVVYVLLFFLFTTVTITISSGINRNLFEDRATAINITAINKLQYNLLESSSKSYNVTKSVEDTKTILRFSNKDEYVYDSIKQIIYKNGGKLVSFVKKCEINLRANYVELDITLNKYNSQLQRTICVKGVTTPTYASGIKMHYDGINNTGKGVNDPNSKVWQDINGNSAVADGWETATSDGWTKNGFLLEKFSGDNSSNQIRNVFSIEQAQKSYPDVTIEYCITPESEWYDSKTNYLYTITLENNTERTLLLGLNKYGIGLMYGSGSNTVFGDGPAIEANKTYTITFVQEGLNSRKLYINGVLVKNVEGLSLNNIAFTNLKINKSCNGSANLHSLRIYDRALSENEILDNYNIDKLRFEE